MTGRLAGQTVLVTGAGRGLGRAVAVGLASEGAAVWVCARSEPELQTTAELIRAQGGAVEVRRVDLADDGACADLVASILATAGRVDVLVNNAAVLDLLPLEEIGPDRWGLTLGVNLTAPFLLSQGLLPGMRTRGGSIVNVSSRAGVLGFANEAAYCAAKFGLEGLTRAMAIELKGAPVSINTVTPGLKIKPTSVTDAQAVQRPARERDAWNEPARLVPAFVWLARLRGEVSGHRFDAHALSRRLAREGFELSPERAGEVAE